MAYWDIRDYLAEEELITVKFKEDALGLEFLDPSKDFSDMVPQNEPIEVPIWKAISINIYTEQSGVLVIKMPSFFDRNNFMETVKALSSQGKIECANLKEKSLYFYHLAQLLREFLSKPTGSASDPNEIAQIFLKRAINIICLAWKSYGSKEADLNKPGYTLSESRLYSEALKKTIEFSDWRLKRNIKKKA